MSQACDDSLVTIFMATNSDERFTGQVGKIIASVKSIGELINRGDFQKSREQLFTLMQLWIEFDNGYLIQPPFPVDDISIWRQQSSRIAERIGAIHAKFKDNRFDRVHPDLDFLVTDLTSLYAQKVAQRPLFQTLIQLDALAAALNPAIDDGISVASSARHFSLTLDTWKSLDPSPAFQQELETLQGHVRKLAATPVQNPLKRNELCQIIRADYEVLKRQFVLPNVAKTPTNQVESAEKASSETVFPY